MRILFLSANPVRVATLDLEEELRNLELQLGAVKYRDQISLIARHAVQPDDLVRHVRAEKPTVVHFSGHGTEDGIILRNDQGSYQPITGDSLRQFFTDRGVELVVLNSCVSGIQAEAIVSAVPMVIGTTGALDDEAARRFTAAFYRTLGSGDTVKEAFRDGQDAVALHGKGNVFLSLGELDRSLCLADPR
jgi:hypothetical protein